MWQQCREEMKITIEKCFYLSNTIILLVSYEINEFFKNLFVTPANVAIGVKMTLSSVDIRLRVRRQIDYQTKC